MSMIDAFIRKDDIERALSALETAERVRRNRISDTLAAHLGSEPSDKMIDDVLRASSQAESISFAAEAVGGILGEILGRVAQNLREVSARR